MAGGVASHRHGADGRLGRSPVVRDGNDTAWRPADTPREPSPDFRDV